MRELSLLRDYIRKRIPYAKKHSNEPFEAVFASFNPESFWVDTDVGSSLALSEESRALLQTWDGWMAVIEGDRRAGYRVIKRIQKEIFYRPEPFIVLGMVALYEGNRNVAVKSFRRVAKLSPHDKATIALVREFGLRKPPVLSFLDRGNPINVALGRLRAKFNQ